MRRDDKAMPYSLRKGISVAQHTTTLTGACLVANGLRRPSRGRADISVRVVPSTIQLRVTLDDVLTQTLQPLYHPVE